MFNIFRFLFKKRKRNYHNNEVKRLHLYKMGDTWLFNDKHLDIVGEPFVPSASEVITELANANSLLIGEVTDAEILIGENLNEYDAEITLKEDNWGSTYLYGDKELWLCPVLLRFFAVPPKRIRVLFV